MSEGEKSDPALNDGANSQEGTPAAPAPVPAAEADRAPEPRPGETEVRVTAGDVTSCPPLAPKLPEKTEAPPPPAAPKPTPPPPPDKPPPPPVPAPPAPGLLDEFFDEGDDAKEEEGEVWP